jgi:hypothetical protein
MLGQADLRKLINRVNADKTGKDPSTYYADICNAIERYFLMMIPGVTPQSQASATRYWEGARSMLDDLARMRRQHHVVVDMRNRGPGPATEPYMVDANDANDDDETDDDDDEEVDPQVLRSLRQQQALLRAAHQPGVFLREPQQQQRRQFQQYAQDPDDGQDVFGAQTQQQLAHMTSGVGRRPRLEDLQANSLYADEVDDDNFAVPRGGASGSKKRRGSKPKPKKRIATKSKGKKHVPKRKK